MTSTIAGLKKGDMMGFAALRHWKIQFYLYLIGGLEPWNFMVYGRYNELVNGGYIGL